MTSVKRARVFNFRTLFAGYKPTKSERLFNETETLKQLSVDQIYERFALARPLLRDEGGRLLLEKYIAGLVNVKSGEYAD